MLVGAACCPHPPLLVPEVAAGAAPELDPLRVASDSAIRQLLASGPDLVVLVGTAESSEEFGRGAWGTLAPYGVPVMAGLNGDRVAEAALPLSLTIGAWLFGRSSWTGPVKAHAVAASAPAHACAALGRVIADAAARVGLLVMGDGSARRSTTAPGYFDPRAEPFDAAVARALREGDRDLLLRLDAGLAAELLVAGRAAWQVLAGAAAGASWRSELCYEGAPYGVGYFVASWTRYRADALSEQQQAASQPADMAGGGLMR